LQSLKIFSKEDSRARRSTERNIRFARLSRGFDEGRGAFSRSLASSISRSIEILNRPACADEDRRKSERGFVAAGPLEEGARYPPFYSRIENARSFAIREQDRLTVLGPRRADRDLFSNVETNEKVGRC
jgi:hypothetical protein